MPVEIRELVIKTTIVSAAREQETSQLAAQNLTLLKQQIMNECLKALREKNHKNILNR